MRIYNKKVFGWGIFMIVLGVFNLIADLTNKKVDVSGIILITALFLFGFGTIMRSLSQKLSKEQMDELGDCDQLVALKSKWKSFKISQAISFFLMLIFFIMGKAAGNEGFIAMGTGLAFAFGISICTEIFTDLYDRSKN